MKKLLVLVLFGLTFYAGFVFGSEFTMVKYDVGDADQYEPPIPQFQHYKIEANIYCLPWSEFRGKAEEIFGESARGVVGFTGSKYRGSGDIYLPIDKKGEIDLKTLGHEVYYHISSVPMLIE